MSVRVRAGVCVCVCMCARDMYCKYAGRKQAVYFYLCWCTVTLVRIPT